MFDDERGSRINRWAKGSSHISKFFFQNYSRLIGRCCANVAYSLGKCEFEPKAIPHKILLNSLSKKRLFPNGSYVSWVSFTDGPTIVNVNLYVRSFEKIDDVKMVLFKQTDTYLSFPDKYFFLQKTRNTVFRSPSGSNGTTTGWHTTT